MGRLKDREKNTLAPYWSNLSPALNIRSPNPFRKMSRSTFIVHHPSSPYSSVPLVNEKKNRNKFYLQTYVQHAIYLIVQTSTPITPELLFHVI